MMIYGYDYKISEQELLTKEGHFAAWITNYAQTPCTEYRQRQFRAAGICGDPNTTDFALIQHIALSTYAFVKPDLTEKVQVVKKVIVKDREKGEVVVEFNHNITGEPVVNVDRLVCIASNEGRQIKLSKKLIFELGRLHEE